MEAGGSRRLPEQPLTWQLPPPQRHRASGWCLPSGWGATGHLLPEVLGHGGGCWCCPIPGQLDVIPVPLVEEGPSSLPSPWCCQAWCCGSISLGLLPMLPAPPGPVPSCSLAGSVLVLWGHLGLPRVLLALSCIVKRPDRGEGQPRCCRGALIPGARGGWDNAVTACSSSSVLCPQSQLGWDGMKVLALRARTAACSTLAGLSPAMAVGCPAGPHPSSVPTCALGDSSSLLPSS